MNPVPPGAQGQKRFRKRSVNITTLPDEQLKVPSRLVVCRARPCAGDIASRPGRCNAAPAAAIAIAAVTIVRTIRPGQEDERVLLQ